MNSSLCVSFSYYFKVYMSTYRYLKSKARDEWIALKEQVKESKLILLFFVCALISVIFYLDPIPDRNIYFATSYKQSDWESFANSAKSILDKKGLDVHVVSTEGAIDNIDKLLDPKSPVNIAFTYASAIKEEDRNKLLSLGSVSYEPVWVFYWKDKIKEPKSLGELENHKVSLGPTKSGSYAIAKMLFGVYKIEIDSSVNFIPDGFEESAKRFESKETDVLIFVSSYRDEIVNKLLNDKRIGLMDFSNAPAFEKKFNSFETVTLPEGSIDILNNIPSKDIHLVATTTSLVVKPDMHPDNQLALLMAIKDLNRSSHHLFFAKRDEFPSYVDPLIPISPAAAKFYDYGPPHAMKYFPFWIAGFMDRAWLLLLALFAVFYPLTKLNVHISKMRYEMEEDVVYKELVEIENLALSQNLTDSQRFSLISRLEQLAKEALKSRVPVGSGKDHFDLMKNIEGIKSLLVENK